MLAVPEGSAVENKGVVEFSLVQYQKTRPTAPTDDFFDQEIDAECTTEIDDYITTNYMIALQQTIRNLTHGNGTK